MYVFRLPRTTIEEKERRSLKSHRVPLIQISMAWIDLGSKRCGQAISVFTNQHSHQKMDGTHAKCYWKCDFSFNPHARLFVGWLVGWSVG